MAKGDANECRDVGLADLRHDERHTEAPGRAVAVLQYGLLACALFGLIRLAREIRDREMSRDRHAAGLIQSRRTILKNSNQV